MTYTSSTWLVKGARPSGSWRSGTSHRAMPSHHVTAWHAAGSWTHGMLQVTGVVCNTACSASRDNNVEVPLIILSHLTSSIIQRLSLSKLLCIILDSHGHPVHGHYAAAAWCMQRTKSPMGSTDHSPREMSLPSTMGSCISKQCGTSGHVGSM